MPCPVDRERRHFRLGGRVCGHLRRGIVDLPEVRQLAGADLAGHVDLPAVDVFAEPRPLGCVEPCACVGHAHHGHRERQAFARGPEGPLSVYGNPSRLARILVGMAFLRCGQALQSVGIRMDIRGNRDVTILDRHTCHPLHCSPSCRKGTRTLDNPVINRSHHFEYVTYRVDAGMK